jgi:hypothetical protein
MRNILSANQTPKFETNKTVWPKACPREGCGGDVGRFQEYEGHTFKCLMCNREVPTHVLN